MWLPRNPHFVREARIEVFRTSGPSPPTAARCGRQVGFRRTAQLLDAGFPLLGRQLREAGMPACGRAVRAPPRSIPLFAPENQSPFLRHPREDKPRRPWRAPKSKCGGRARSARGSPRPAGDAHRGRSSHQHSIDRHSCITTAESVRSNLIFSNRIRQRSSR